MLVSVVYGSKKNKTPQVPNHHHHITSPTKKQQGRKDTWKKNYKKQKKPHSIKPGAEGQLFRYELNTSQSVNWSDWNRGEKKRKENFTQCKKILCKSPQKQTKKKPKWIILAVRNTLPIIYSQRTDSGIYIYFSQQYHLEDINKCSSILWRALKHQHISLLPITQFR